MSYNIDMKQLKSLEQKMPWLLIVTGFIGLIASFILTLDKFELLKNPGYSPSCNLNPVLSCGSIIGTEQASAFGFPNPIIGLIGFSVVITIGVSILAGAKFKKWFWQGLNSASVLAFVFVHWLIYQSLYSIGALCIYCMCVWTITWIIVWYVTLYNLREGNVKTPEKLKGLVAFAQRHHLDILITWYVIVTVLILENFWYYWKTLL